MSTPDISYRQRLYIQVSILFYELWIALFDVFCLVYYSQKRVRMKQAILERINGFKRIFPSSMNRDMYL